ncbi:MAG TPA: carboxypeptidase regulatory-like domain-containing protein [Thermoanaerobaculia bacterium]|jgi:hypothetical protein
MHDRSRVRWRAAFVLALLFSLLSSLPATAQYQTGNIHGVVTDNTGGALPGVTVTLSGIGAPRTFVTDAEGTFRFLSLDPGTYQLSAELAGFGTVTRRNIDVNVGRNTTADLQMQPALSETVTVTAQAPLIDTRQTGTSTTIEEEELQNLPSARDPWVIMQQVPGVLIDRTNVGGNESGQQSVFVGKGTGMGQNTWNLDGVNITDTSQFAGFSPGYYDFDTVAEMQVATGGSDPSVRSAGVNLNIVTKRGGNEIRGSARYFTTDRQWQADPTVPGEATAYLSRVNEVDNVQDFGAELGGPLVRDKLWFYAGYAEQNIKNLAAAGPAGKQQLYKDDTFLTNANLKLNAQLIPNNSAMLMYYESAKEKIGRSAGPTRPPETSWYQGHMDEGPLVGGLPVFKIEDTHMFNQNLYLTGLYAESNHTFFFEPLGGVEKDSWRDHLGVWHDTFVYYSSERPTTNARADGSAFVGTGGIRHELKFGFGYRDAPTTSVSAWPGSGNFGLFFGNANNLALAYLMRDQVAKFGVEAYDAYIGDTVVWNNLTLQGGLRFDMQSGANFASSVPANSLVPDLLPAVNFAGDERELEWNSISPRIGATYAFGGDGRTLGRAAYNRYADQLSGANLFAANPFPFAQAIVYYWDDANGDKHIQRPEIDFDYGLYNWYGLDPANPAAPFSTTRIDYDMDVPTTDEFIIGAEHALLPQFTIGANYTYRQLEGQVFGMAEKTRGKGDLYTAADYVLAGNATGTLPNGESYSVPYYKRPDGVPAPLYSVLTNRPGYSRTYNGIELFATKRMSNRWSMRANVAWNDWKQNLDNEWGTNGDPTHLQTSYGCSSCDGSSVVEGSGTQSGNKAGVFMNSRWSYVLTGVVELPFAINLGVTASGREGYPIPYHHGVPVNSTAKNVLINDIGEYRLENAFNVDLKLSKEVRVGGLGGLTLSVDVFNATDERTVLQRQNRLYTNLTTPNVAANRIMELQSPRVFRVGARMTF